MNKRTKQQLFTYVKITMVLFITYFFVMLYGANHHEEVKGLFSVQNDDNIVPATRVDANKLMIYDDKIVIYQHNAGVFGYKDTGSMKPTLDHGHHGIYIPVTKTTELQIGDIISYEGETMNITHRIIDIQNDCYVLKGDNNYFTDGCINRDQITKVLIGIIY